MSFRNKRPSKPFVSPFSHPSKIPKPTVTTTTAPPPPSQPPSQSVTTSIDQLVSILADAGCTLINTSGPPCLPADVHKLRHRLQSRFLLDPVLRSKFLAGFGAYIDSRNDLRRLVCYCSVTYSEPYF
ncbi:hypothetical protein HanOQP8_Chr07g0246701 [Helianthus annuus]|nr:hypothetical protein HanOQP8_Chr07g0246701 [Helianthus annuus]